MGLAEKKFVNQLQEATEDILERISGDVGKKLDAVTFDEPSFEKFLLDFLKTEEERVKFITACKVRVSNSSSTIYYPPITSAIYSFVLKDKVYKEAVQSSIKKIHLVFDGSKNTPSSSKDVDLILVNGILTFTANHTVPTCCGGDGTSPDKFIPFFEKLESCLS